MLRKEPLSLKLNSKLGILPTNVKLLSSLALVLFSEIFLFKAVPEMIQKVPDN